MKLLVNRNVRDFGWEIAHEAVSRRPPISLSTIVARTGRGLQIRRERLGFVHRSSTISCRPVPSPDVTIRTSCIAGTLQVVLRNIRAFRSVEFPKGTHVNSDARTLITALMQRDPEERLGSRDPVGDYASIKASSWFNDVSAQGSMRV
jgi:hypothetical protein